MLQRLLLPAALALAAASPVRAEPPDAVAAAPAPDRAGPVALIPRVDPRQADGFAIEALPAAPRPAMPAPRPAALPDAPPLAVVIRFDPRGRGAADRAASLATALRTRGLAVADVGPAAAPVVDAIRFAFDEDAPAAAAVARDLPGTLGRLLPLRDDPRDAVGIAPGTVSITLGPDRRTS